MTVLEKIVQWLGTYSGNDRLQSMTVDYLTPAAETGNIIPSGLTDEEFGYQEPPRKPKPKDHDSQLSLF